MSITPNNADPDVQYADDIEFDVIQPDPEVTVALEMTQLPLDIRAGIEGAKLDDKGVMVQSANDTPPYYAIGAKAELRAGGFRYIWLLKCRATPMTEQYIPRRAPPSPARRDRWNLPPSSAPATVTGSTLLMRDRTALTLRRRPPS